MPETAPCIPIRNIHLVHRLPSPSFLVDGVYLPLTLRNTKHLSHFEWSCTLLTVLERSLCFCKLHLLREVFVTSPSGCHNTNVVTREVLCAGQWVCSVQYGECKLWTRAKSCVTGKLIAHQGFIQTEVPPPPPET